MDKIFALNNTFNIFENVPSITYHWIQKIESILDLIKVLKQRRQGRKELSRLNVRLLKDIGLTKGEVWVEINKPFWRE